MPYRYHCPKCHALLNPNVRVVLIAEHGNDRGIVLMSSQLGDYQVIADKGFCSAIAPGAAVEFHCPVCAGSLTSKLHPTFAELAVISIDHPDEGPCLLRFSRVSDEQATFLYDGDTVREFGEAAVRFRANLDVEGDWSW
jgi:hypothetical protein